MYQFLDFRWSLNGFWKNVRSCLQGEVSFAPKAIIVLCIASSESSNMSFMSAVRVVEYLDSAITAAVELVAVRGCPADEGGHGTGHVTLQTRGPVTASLPQYCVILSFYLLSSRYFLFLIIRLVCFYLNTYERTLQNCRNALMSRC